MVKDLRRDPVFWKKPPPKISHQVFSKDLLLRYRKAVDRTVASRTWIMLFVGAAVYIAYNLLDRSVYPEQALLFFKIRVTGALLAVLACLPSFFKKTEKFSIWCVDITAVLLTGGISLMIYLTNGTSSHYYAGINLTLLGMAIINGFYFWHNLITSFVVIGLFVLAALANETPWNGPIFFAACFFMCSTVLFSVLMTRFFSAMHFRSFIQHERLKEDERKLAILYGIAEERSKIDDLTKIYNRRYFLEVLADKIQTCKAMKSFFFLIIFDIDHFKKINDTYGHIFGDQVISSVARVVRDMMRLSSYIGRYGGDEFMLIIDKATQEELLLRLENVRQAIRNLKLFCDGEPVSISASFGAARWEPGMTDERKLIELADMALLEVKRGRRGEINLAN